MRCPICAKASVPDYKPFCSRRCADIDLGRWLNESYVLPAAPTEEDDTASDDPAPPRPQ